MLPQYEPSQAQAAARGGSVVDLAASPDNDVAASTVELVHTAQGDARVCESIELKENEHREHNTAAQMLVAQTNGQEGGPVLEPLSQMAHAQREREQFADEQRCGEPPDQGDKGHDRKVDKREGERQLEGDCENQDGTGGDKDKRRGRPGQRRGRRTGRMGTGLDRTGPTQRAPFVTAVDHPATTTSGAGVGEELSFNLAGEGLDSGQQLSVLLVEDNRYVRRY